MTTSGNPNRDAIADEAAAWFVQNRNGPLDRQDSAAFMAWLRASPAHVEEYLALAAIADDLRDATAGPAEDLESILAQVSGSFDNVVPIGHGRESSAPADHPARATRYWPRAAAVAALALGIAAGTIWMNRDGERFGLARTYVTARAEQRAQQLPDGTVMHLNADSAATVRFTRGQRVVRIERGEAFFEVAHEVARQFRVDAGKVGVTAVGTHFDVYQRDRDVMVTVTEGAVRVDTGTPPATESLRLESGHRILVNDRLGTPQRIEARLAVAWLRGQIAFEDQPLGEVAAEFNRYNRPGLVIADANVRALRIGGVFDAYDIDSFVAFLGTLPGVVVERTPDRILVRPRVR